MPQVNVLETDLTVLVIVDVQEKILAAIESSPKDTIIDRMLRLIGVAGILEIPVLFTEQYPKGLGPTDERVRRALPEGLAVIEKSTCSCWRDASFRRQLQETEREQVLIAGLESHVCIQQTVFDLLRVDYVPFVASDAIGSRTAADTGWAIERMRQAGAAVSSVEAFMFELIERCDHPKFKDILKRVK